MEPLEYEDLFQFLADFVRTFDPDIDPNLLAIRIDSFLDRHIITE